MKKKLSQIVMEGPLKVEGISPWKPMFVTVTRRKGHPFTLGISDSGVAVHVTGHGTIANLGWDQAFTRLTLAGAKFTVKKVKKAA